MKFFSFNFCIVILLIINLVSSVDWVKNVRVSGKYYSERSWTKVPPVEVWWTDSVCERQSAPFTLPLWGLSWIPAPSTVEPTFGDDRVRVTLYDIGGKMTEVLSNSVRKKLPLIPHMGVRVFGKEFFFSDRIDFRFSSSMEIMLPRNQYPRIDFDLGSTSRREESINEWIRNASSKYNRETYNLWDRNCNHFAEEFVSYLLPETGIPPPILNPILDISDSMMDSVPSWRRSIGTTFMNEFSRFILISWGSVIKGEKKRLDLL